MDNKLNIKEIRKTIGYSQQKLAEAIDVPKSRISQWELGNGSPKVEDYLKLTKFLSKLFPDIDFTADVNILLNRFKMSNADFEINAFMTENNLSDTDIAVITGKSIRAVQSWKRGERKLQADTISVLKQSLNESNTASKSVSLVESQQRTIEAQQRTIEKLVNMLKI